MCPTSHISLKDQLFFLIINVSITCMSLASQCHAKRALFVENNTEEIFEAALEQSTDIMYSDVEIFVAIAR